MKFKCEKHGIVENLPDINLNLYCPHCYRGALVEFSEKTFGKEFNINVLTDKYGRPILTKAWAKDIVVTKIGESKR